jgi:membrane protease YdiL (CAAX protease family)
MRKRHRAIIALIEVLLLFLPGIPAYLWLWPNVEGTHWQQSVQIIVYLYFLIGCLIIGLRRWNLDQLGLNRQGLWISLLSGFSILLGRYLVYIATSLPVSLQPFSLSRLAGEFAFYFGMVGFIEELLFRGLIYHAFEEWGGIRLAIWGSTIAFGLYHLGGQGLLGFIGTSILGLIFAVIRWRAGGIVGLILVHGMIDILAIEIQTPIGPQQLQQVQIEQPLLIVLGYLLLLGPVLYLWKLYPKAKPSMDGSDHSIQ